MQNLVNINVNQIVCCSESELKNALTELNSKTSEYGLFLKPHEINRLAAARTRSLKENGRVEIGVGILPVLAEEFCTSLFVTRENYAALLERILDVFFFIKTAVCDCISDADLVRLLKDYYETKCLGSVEAFGDSDMDLLVKYIENRMDEKNDSITDTYDSEGYTDERV